MAYSAAALSSAETTGFDADKVMMVVQSAGAPTDAHWTYKGQHDGTDKTEADKPATRAYDSFGSLLTEATSLKKNITGATQENPCKITSTGHGLVTNDNVFIKDVGGMTQINDTAYTITRVDDNNYTLNGVDATSGHSAYTSGGTGTSVCFYNFAFSGISFDTLCITGHNFNSAGFISVSLEIADNSAFSSNLIEIAKYTVSGTTDNRILITNLNSAGGSSTYSSGGTAQRYSAVVYARLKVLHATSTNPELGEIFLGTRYQLQRNPDTPYNNKEEFSEVTAFKSLSGITKRYVAYRGQAFRRVKSSLATSAEIAVVDDWWNAIEEGTKPFLYIENPSSGHDTRLMILEEPLLSFSLVGPFERVLELSMSEQPPFLSRES